MSVVFTYIRNSSRAFEYDKQESIESDAIAITEPDDELVEGNNSVDDGFVEVIDGADGTAEDGEMDPLYSISAGEQPSWEKLRRLMSI